MIDLKQRQKLLLNLLKEFDQFCSKYDIQYWLEGGTLLGAIRHKGFIPWDDDVDVAMTRDNYIKFLAIGEKYLPSNLKIENFNNTKIRKIFFIKVIDVKNNVFLDVFPMDIIKKEYIKFYYIIRFFLGISYNDNVKSFKNTIKKIIYNTINYLDRQKLLNFFSNILNNPKSDYIIYGLEAYSALAPGKIFYIKKDNIFPLKKHIFEDSFFYIPNNYDEYLKKLYGNYMKLPPKKDRFPTHYNYK